MQFKLLNILKETVNDNLQEDDAVIDLTRPDDFSAADSLDDLRRTVKGAGLKYGKTTLTRERGIELANAIKVLEGHPKSEIFKEYLNKLFELISSYQTGSYSLKKLGELIVELINMDAVTAQEQMEEVISIFEDPRFADKHKKKLIKLLTQSGKIDLDEFFKETRRAYLDYEESFAEGELSPFLIYKTSPTIGINLNSDLIYNNMVISAREFNSQSSDVNKILYVLDKIAKSKFYTSPEAVIKTVFSSLNFKINFDYSPNNVKADLKLKESLIYENRDTRKVTVIGGKGQNVEVKYNVYTTPSYLSEFFKIDASTENYNELLNYIGRIPKVTDIKENFDVMMYYLINNLVSSVKKQSGDKIINHLTKDLVGIIFKDGYLIPKDNIMFYWNTIGYAKRKRMSIYYEVINNPTIYKITSHNDSYSRFVMKVQ